MPEPLRLPPGAHATAFRAILHRELLRFWGQKGRLVAALVRPLVLVPRLRRRLPRRARPVDHPALRHLHHLRDLHRPRPAGHDLPVQRHAVLAQPGLRPRDGLDAAPARPRPCPAAGSCFSKLAAGALVSLLQCAVFLALAAALGRARAAPGLRPGAPRAARHRPDARRARPPALLADPPAGKLRRRDELRHLPDVLPVLRALPAVEDAGSLAAARSGSAR